MQGRCFLHASTYLFPWSVRPSVRADGRYHNRRDFLACLTHALHVPGVWAGTGLTAEGGLPLPCCGVRDVQGWVSLTVSPVPGTANIAPAGPLPPVRPGDGMGLRKRYNRGYVDAQDWLAGQVAQGRVHTRLLARLPVA